jgi:hypothetical protein
MVTFTGRFIYENILKIVKELDELGEACDVVSNELGQQSLAYDLLNKQYNTKRQELDNALNVQYSAQYTVNN